MSHPSIPCSFTEFETAAGEFLRNMDAGATEEEACSGFKCLTLMLSGLDYCAEACKSEQQIAHQARAVHDVAERKMLERGFPAPSAYLDQLEHLFH